MSRVTPAEKKHREATGIARNSTARVTTLEDFLECSVPEKLDVMKVQRRSWSSVAKQWEPDGSFSNPALDAIPRSSEQVFAKQRSLAYSRLREARAEERQVVRQHSGEQLGSQEEKLEELRTNIQKSKSKSLLYERQILELERHCDDLQQLKVNFLSDDAACSALVEDAESLIEECTQALHNPQDEALDPPTAVETPSTEFQQTHESHGSLFDSESCSASEDGGSNRDDNADANIGRSHSAHAPELFIENDEGEESETERSGDGADSDWAFSDLAGSDGTYGSDNDNEGESLDDFEEKPTLPYDAAVFDRFDASPSDHQYLEYENGRNQEHTLQERQNQLDVTIRSTTTCWDDEVFNANSTQRLFEHEADENLKSGGSSVFERLHAEHAEKLKKMDQQRMEKAERLESEWQELQRKSSKKKRVSGEVGSVPVYEKLFACASKQNQKRVTEVQRRDSEELKYLEKKSVHRNSDKTPDMQRLDRLHEDHQQKLRSLEQKRQDQYKGTEQKTAKGSPAFTQKVGQRLFQHGAAREERLQRQRAAREQQLTEKSVHGKVNSKKGPSRSERLYKEAEKRRQEQQKQKKMLEDEQASIAAKAKKPSAKGKLGSDRLYRDATRRIEVQREAQRRREQEDRERLEQESAHFELLQQRKSDVGSGFKIARSSNPMASRSAARANSRQSPMVAKTPPKHVQEAELAPDMPDVPSPHPLMWTLTRSSALVLPRCDGEDEVSSDCLQRRPDELEWRQDIAKPGLEGVCQVIEALQNNIGLRKLLLSGMGLNCQAEAAKHHAALEHLEMPGNDLGTEGGKALATVIESNKALQHLDIRGSNLNDGALAIVESLRCSNCLRILDLCMNALGPQEAAILGKVLEENQTLQELYLSDNEFEDQGIIPLVDAAGVNNVLLVLNIGGNGIHVDGGRAVGRMMERNNVLQRLLLSGNELGVDGGRAIGEALVVNSGLHHLDLCGNIIEVEGCSAIADALKVNTHLRHLELCVNAILSEGAQALGGALISNSTLEQLEVGWNRIGNDGASALANALEQNASLRNLNLVSNHLEEIAGANLLAALQVNNSIRHLCLDGNDVCPSDTASIEELLRVNRRLCEERSGPLASPG